MDLERAYRQLRADPLAYPLLVVQHEGQIFIYICPSFGCRSSGAAQQRVSQAVCHILKQSGHVVLAYVDALVQFKDLKRRLKRAVTSLNKPVVTLALKYLMKNPAAQHK